MSQFAANLKNCRGFRISRRSISLDADGNFVAAIENKAGSQGSLAVCWRKPTAPSRRTRRARGWTFAEHADDARQFPGKHPNIDRLLGLIEERKRYASNMSLRGLIRRR